MVFPDTSPRGLPEDLAHDDNSNIGHAAGFYCNATKSPWNKYFNMYTYCTEELPSLVSKYFFADLNNKSVMGYSMGGGGALVLALKNPNSYKSVSAFCPIMDAMFTSPNPEHCSSFAK
mmetsp:Transcript_28599/g.20660  ORF Transcript_28599/g.20660 Transcript_28599/m.20660 type:complete len:118 (-) Transcript_28599:330-683(-)|eukprot:CAMPEP_0116874978 /NCGR_PEP_ID=MMETSP0463-20121206/6656_1 /TAXON_ID=181622 /ORGANISM="Strombidinopsis sp, Strain SopsisLIS2011" /LENGTH=117 /DNA_ID=CAMNT_0004519595 /DNA_START=1339 /DNA_END=1692 /DNA_ORIENTATION=+